MPAWIDRFRQYASNPFPQRLSAQDTNEYVQPQPTYDPQYYLTYWNGNQLPGQFIHNNDPIQEWMSVSTRQILYTSSPQGAMRAAGSFNQNLSQQNSAQIMATWGAAWKQLAAQQAASAGR